MLDRGWLIRNAITNPTISPTAPNTMSIVENFNISVSKASIILKPVFLILGERRKNIIPKTKLIPIITKLFCKLDNSRRPLLLNNTPDTAPKDAPITAITAFTILSIILSPPYKYNH